MQLILGNIKLSIEAVGSFTMIDNFDVNGVWKGEYAYEDKFQPTILKSAIPFILRMKLTLDAGKFSGICQDDPESSKINIPATIYGTIKDYELFFVKKYPKTFIHDNNGSIIIGDEPHPDIMYRAKINSQQRLSGTWHIERTFRKVSGQVIEIPKINGQWWIEKF
ncbi:MAG: hypothetical protein O9262_02160 [Cyclobacteriaceae bacterium]|nr:hypothetical protein [Cyclobacteriaceae bacterium]